MVRQKSWWNRGVFVSLILLCFWPQVAPAMESDPYIRPLHAALQRTAAGRSLLEAVSGQGDRHGVVGLDLLVGEMESVISGNLGLIIDGSDVILVEAAHELGKMPRRLRREPTAAVMVLLDEWVRGISGCRARPALIDRFRRSDLPKHRSETRDWLETYFPVLFRFACSAMANAPGRYRN